MFVKSRLPCAATVLCLSPAGQRDQYNFAAIGELTEAPGGLITDHFRHSEVQEDDLGFEGGGDFRRLSPVVSHANIHGQDFQQHDEAVGHVRIVVHDQDAP